MSYADIDAATVEFRAKKAVKAIYDYRRSKQYELAAEIKKKGFRNFWFKKVEDTRSLEEIINEERERRERPFGATQMRLFEYDFDKAEQRLLDLITICADSQNGTLIHVSAKDWRVLMYWFDRAVVAKGEGP